MTVIRRARRDFGRFRMACRAWMNDRRLDRTIRQALRSDRISDEQIAAIERGWANPKPGFVADSSYLRAVVDRAADGGQGAVVECGTGVSTILLAIVAQRTGRLTVSLEHDERWHGRVARVLARNGLNRAKVVLAPLQGADGDAWYGVSPEQLPEQVTLCVCDGPPGALADRGLAVARLGSRLVPGAEVFFDDTDRSEERAAVERWVAEFGLHVVEEGARWTMLETARN